MGSKGKKALIFPILFLSLIGALVFVSTTLTVFSERLNQFIFGRKFIATQSDKVQVLLKIGYFLGFYLFIIASLVMSIRVLTGKSTPASGNDPIIINTLNRIISNTIQQSIIFLGLYAPLLFNEIDHVTQIGRHQILSIAAIFIAGRIFFAIGYIIGGVIGISTLRGFGFAIAVFTNTLLISYHLGFNSFQLLKNEAGPLLHDVFSDL